MNILIADDEFIIRQGLLSLRWNSIGIDQVFSAENGILAKEMLETHQIDIVISDIKMPGLTGLELAEYLKNYSMDTLIILLTGFGEFEYAKRAITNQVFDYLLKPLKTKELFDSVTRAVFVTQQKKYKDKVVREYEHTIGAFNNTEQILHSFRSSNHQVLDILKYMAQNYNMEVCLHTLGERYHFNSIYLSRLIKSETGFAFIDILNAIRLMNAAYLLKEEKVKIQMVCEKTGFRDQRYFSQLFKRTFGCTPIDYRKNLGNEKDYTIREILDGLDKKRKMV